MTVLPMNWRWVKLSFIQSSLVLTALVVAWLLRFDFKLPEFATLFGAGAILVGVRLSAMTLLDLHHDRWSHTGIPELERLGKAVALGSAGFFVFMRWIFGILQFPRSVYVLEGLLSLLFLAAPRVAVRMFVRARRLRNGLITRIPVLLVGAGEAASLLLREMEKTSYTPVGLVDDDPAKLGTRLSGVAVLGAVDRLPQLTEALAVKEIFIAIPSATRNQLLRITAYCQRTGVPFRSLPGLDKLIDCRVDISELHKVNVEDLLGREPVKLEDEGVRSRLSGRVVMITGAAGSIGSELSHQIMGYHPSKLICVD